MKFNHNIVSNPAINAILIAGLFLIAPFHVSSQKILIEFDTIYDLKIKSSDGLLMSKSETIYYCKLNNDEHIILHNLYTNEALKIENKFSKLGELKSFNLLDSLLILNFYKKSMIFEIKDSIVQLIDSVSHNYEYSRIISNKEVLFYKNYNYSPLSCVKEERTRFGIYNIEQNDFMKEQNFQFNYIFYTHLINNFIDFSSSKKEILIAQTYPYEINILDKNLNLLNQIEDNLDQDRSVFDSLQNIENKMLKEGKGVKTFIGELSKTDNRVNRINKAYFLNDTTILIVKKMSKDVDENSERILDVWRFNGKKWVNIIENQRYFSSWLNLSEKSTTVHVPFRQSEQVIFHNQYIYVVGDYFPFHEFKTFKDLTDYASRVDYSNINKAIVRFKYEIK